MADAEQEVLETEAPELEQETEQEAEQLSEVDLLAKELGWRPKSEWDGDETTWTDSKSFLKKSREINRTLSRELKDIKKTVEGIGKASARMTQQAVEKERERVLALRDEAFETGDRDSFAKAERELAKLETPVAAPAAENFAERNSSWFQKDDDATGYAFARADYYAKRGVTDPEAQLAKVEEDVRKRFPELFEAEAEPKKPEPRKAPALGAPQRQVSTQPREKGVATLPPDARKAMKDWVSSMKENGNEWATEKVWADNFYASQEAANG
jgi:hypothetical protein